MSSLNTRESIIDDLLEVRFSFECDGEYVPGLMYLPAEPEEDLPFVLIQHPGMGSKDDYFVADVARMWARRGWICAGLDAPMHGERRDHDPMALFRDRDRYPEVARAFAAEVAMMLDLVGAEYPVDTARLGFTGFSLGSMLGIPAVGTHGGFKVAAFCLVGEGGLVGPVTGPDSHVAGLAATAVRVVAKTNDELIPRAATEALYEALPGKKDIVWLPGGHFEIGPDVIQAAGDWLKAEL
jgi:predicted esterase